MGHGDGLALAIFIAMILMVLGGLLFGVLPGWMMARHLGWSGRKRLLITLGLGAIGAGGGILMVIATFNEDMWAPPPQVTLNVPPGFTQNWLILLEDPKSSTQLVWKGVEIPFFGKKTSIDVPASGIMRVRDLSELRYPSPGTITWSDGSCFTAWAGGLAPESTGAIRLMAFNRLKPNCGAPHPDFPDDEALGAYIAERTSRGEQPILPRKAREN
jgi:hypothetical protein